MSISLDPDEGMYCEIGDIHPNSSDNSLSSPSRKQRSTYAELDMNTMIAASPAAVSGTKPLPVSSSRLPKPAKPSASSSYSKDYTDKSISSHHQRHMAMPVYDHVALEDDHTDTSVALVGDYVDSTYDTVPDDFLEKVSVTSHKRPTDGDGVVDHLYNDISGVLSSSLSRGDAEGKIRHTNSGVGGKEGVSPAVDSEGQNLYAMVNTSRAHQVKPSMNSSDEEDVPAGWKRCGDDKGVYYWEVKTGIIQRDVPLLTSRTNQTDMNCLYSDSDDGEAPHPPVAEKKLSTGSSDDGVKLQLDNRPLIPPHSDSLHRNAAVSLSNESTGSDTTERGHQSLYLVQSLGFVNVAESSLVDQAKSCSAINDAISQLSDSVRTPASGKNLILEINSRKIIISGREDQQLVTTQPIQQVRMWGVGSINPCDFAYIARDQSTRIHKCHVFRCEVPARRIATHLKHICSKLAADKQQKGGGQHSERQTPMDGEIRERLTNSNISSTTRSTSLDPISFPAPMDQPKKTIKCHYLGSHPVHKQVGMDVLNDAIERVYRCTTPNSWVLAGVTITPSTVLITDLKQPEKVIITCRVRYLTFMGINDNVKLAGFISHTADDEYVAQIFHCEPSAGPLCKTLQAACKLRYQKVLDAHPADRTELPESSPLASKSFQATVKEGFQSVWSKLNLHRK